MAEPSVESVVEARTNAAVGAVVGARAGTPVIALSIDELEALCPVPVPIPTSAAATADATTVARCARPARFESWVRAVGIIMASYRWRSRSTRRGKFQHRLTTLRSVPRRLALDREESMGFGWR